MSEGGGTKVGLGVAGGVAAAGFIWSSTEGRASIEWAWRFFSSIIDTSPISMWAIALSVLAGWLVTLRVGMLPLKWLSPTGAALVAQMAGSVSSFAVVWLLWRQPLGLIVGVLIGLASPYTWSLMLILLEVCPGEWASRWAKELRGEGRKITVKPPENPQ
ncbi:MAG TPA: hypothetical protein VFH85_07815 [Gammaproteobacteria bacterium]|nr:hypothetical protein [Gammaproteobacteria bacterium]